MSGDHKAVEMALEAAPPEEPEDEQLDFLGLPQSSELIALREKRGPGRPPGARNRRTIEMAEYLLKRYASPLEVLAQIATARVDELSVQMKCSAIEALQEKRLAAIALIPYLHQKQPVAIDVTKREVVYLNINVNEAVGAAVEETADAPETLTLTARVVSAIKDEPQE